MRFNSARAAIWVLAALAAGNVVPGGFAQRTAKSAAAADTLFAPLQQWKVDILAGDAAALRALYSTDPAAEVEAPAGKISPDADVVFWTGLKARQLKLEISEADGSQSGLQEIVFHAEIAVLDANGKLLFSQKNGEFNNARALAPEDLLEFLRKWKG